VTACHGAEAGVTRRIGFQFEASPQSRTR
jgi:hypothetical protein